MPRAATSPRRLNLRGAVTKLGIVTSQMRATLPSAAMLLRKYAIPPTKIIQV
jgi:hypothetical protein